MTLVCYYNFVVNDTGALLSLLSYCLWRVPVCYWHGCVTATRFLLVSLYLVQRELGNCYGERCNSLVPLVSDCRDVCTSSQYTGLLGDGVFPSVPNIRGYWVTGYIHRFPIYGLLGWQCISTGSQYTGLLGWQVISIGSQYTVFIGWRVISIGSQYTGLLGWQGISTGSQYTGLLRWRVVSIGSQYTGLLEWRDISNGSLHTGWRGTSTGSPYTRL